MVASVFFVSFFAALFGIAYFFLTYRNRERIAMIDKGTDPAVFQNPRPQVQPVSRESRVKFTLKTGMFFIGLGIGFVISALFREMIHPDDMYALLVVGIVFAFGGGGLVSGFYMGRAIDRKASKE